MNNSKNLALLIISLLLITSCGKEDPIDELTNDGLIDDTERMIMTECSENNLASKTEIENNLIGEWKLIGHGQTIFQENPQPNINLTISDISLIIEFKNDNVDLVDTLSWEIEETSSSAGQSFSLRTAPKYTSLILHQFCDTYMYGETSPINDGGNMYLYEKVK